MNLDPQLLALVVCPACRSELRPDEGAQELVCVDSRCGLSYPVRDNIPVLLVDEARSRPEA